MFLGFIKSLKLYAKSNGTAERIPQLTLRQKQREKGKSIAMKIQDIAMRIHEKKPDSGSSCLQCFVC